MRFLPGNNKMKFHIFTIILVLCCSAFGQKTISELKAEHAAVLRNFLSKNKNYQFLSETNFDSQYLKEARQTFGKTMTPYYNTGDFNRDGILDFALILSRKGQPKKSGASADSPWEFDYPLTIVIFNGNKGGSYRTAFVEDIEAPLVSFLDSNKGKKSQLLFGTYATDSGFFLKPKGKGYIVEYPEEL
jgi:hypothetical protein